MRIVLGLAATLALAAGLFLWMNQKGPVNAGPESSPDKESATAPLRLVGPDGALKEAAELPLLELDAEAWQARLTPEQFYILREKGTERAFTGKLNENKAEGLYVCAGCALPLFSSEAKFDSGTGWPSFFQPVAKENVSEETDTKYGMVRTEILCARCEGHLGHVFPDGPQPTGLRYCMNSDAMDFVDKDKVASLAAAEAKNEAKASAPGKWLPLPEGDEPLAEETGEAKAIFAGGCFWCTEAVFEEYPGVIDVVSGYSGGTAETADYKKVSLGSTGHAEGIEITFDPSVTTYGELLRLFFATHDPTTKNRQGPDQGTQYRSAVFYTTDVQKEVVEGYIKQLDASGKYSNPIVTEVSKLEAFYPAEEYHQNFMKNQPNHPYMQMWAVPKIKKAKELIQDTRGEE